MFYRNQKIFNFVVCSVIFTYSVAGEIYAIFIIFSINFYSKCNSRFQFFYYKLWYLRQMIFFLKQNDFLFFFLALHKHFNLNKLAQYRIPKRHWVLSFCRLWTAVFPVDIYTTSIYLFKFNNRNTRTKYEICSKLK